MKTVLVAKGKDLKDIHPLKLKRHLNLDSSVQTPWPVITSRLSSVNQANTYSKQLFIAQMFKKKQWNIWAILTQPRLESSHVNKNIASQQKDCYFAKVQVNEAVTHIICPVQMMKEVHRLGSVRWHWTCQLAHLWAWNQISVYSYCFHYQPGNR